MQAERESRPANLSVAVNGPDLMNIDEAMAVGAHFKQYDSLRSAMLRIISLYLY